MDYHKAGDGSCINRLIQFLVQQIAHPVQSHDEADVAASLPRDRGHLHSTFGIRSVYMQDHSVCAAVFMRIRTYDVFDVWIRAGATPLRTVM